MNDEVYEQLYSQLKRAAEARYHADLAAIERVRGLMAIERMRLGAAGVFHGETLLTVVPPEAGRRGNGETERRLLTVGPNTKRKGGAAPVRNGH